MSLSKNEYNWLSGKKPPRNLRRFLKLGEIKYDLEKKYTNICERCTIIGWNMSERNLDSRFSENRGTRWTENYLFSKKQINMQTNIANRHRTWFSGHSNQNDNYWQQKINNESWNKLQKMFIYSAFGTKISRKSLIFPIETKKWYFLTFSITSLVILTEAGLIFLR